MCVTNAASPAALVMPHAACQVLKLASIAMSHMLHITCSEESCSGSMLHWQCGKVNVVMPPTAMMHQCTACLITKGQKRSLRCTCSKSEGRLSDITTSHRCLRWAWKCAAPLIQCATSCAVKAQVVQLSALRLRLLDEGYEHWIVVFSPYVQ